MSVRSDASALVLPSEVIYRKEGRRTFAAPTGEPVFRYVLHWMPPNTTSGGSPRA